MDLARFVARFTNTRYSIWHLVVVLLIVVVASTLYSSSSAHPPSSREHFYADTGSVIPDKPFDTITAQGCVCVVDYETAALKVFTDTPGSQPTWTSTPSFPITTSVTPGYHYGYLTANALIIRRAAGATIAATIWTMTFAGGGVTAMQLSLESPGKPVLRIYKGTVQTWSSDGSANAGVTSSTVKQFSTCTTTSTGKLCAMTALMNSSFARATNSSAALQVLSNGNVHLTLTTTGNLVLYEGTDKNDGFDAREVRWSSFDQLSTKPTANGMYYAVLTGAGSLRVVTGSISNGQQVMTPDSPTPIFNIDIAGAFAIQIGTKARLATNPNDVAAYMALVDIDGKDLWNTFNTGSTQTGNANQTKSAVGGGLTYTVGGATYVQGQGITQISENTPISPGSYMTLQTISGTYKFVFAKAGNTTDIHMLNGDAILSKVSSTGGIKVTKAGIAYTKAYMPIPAIVNLESLILVKNTTNQAALLGKIINGGGEVTIYDFAFSLSGGTGTLSLKFEMAAISPTNTTTVPCLVLYQGTTKVVDLAMPPPAAASTTTAG